MTNERETMFPLIHSPKWVCSNCGKSNYPLDVACGRCKVLRG